MMIFKTLIQYYLKMGCADSKPPNKQNPNQTNPTNTINFLTKEQVIQKRKEFQLEYTQGHLQPPAVTLPKLPLLEFGGDLSKISQDESAIYNELVSGSQEPGFSYIYRQKGIKKLIQTPQQNIRTVTDVLFQIKKKFGYRRGLGEIIVTNEKGQNGQPIQKRTVKDYTYNWVFDTANNLGKALAHRKLAAKQDLDNVNVIGIYSRNRKEWFLTDWACTLFGYVLAPLYDSLGKQNFSHCIDITGATTLFVSTQTLQEFIKFHQKSTLKTLVLYEQLHDEKLKQQLKDLNLQVLYFWDLVEQGKNLIGPKDKITPRPQDVYSFCFTSGTTGPPKASKIKHSNMVAALVPFIFHNDLAINVQDVHLSYLPLPHLMQRSVSLAFFYQGAFIVVSSGNLTKIKEDVAAAQVTALLSVPRIYNRIVEGVKTTLASMIKDQAHRPQIEKAVFQKVRQSFGGKLRLCLTGSAPINPAVQEYIQKIMQCPFLQGYGQTQTPCAVFISRKTKSRFGIMDQISAAAQVRLADIPEMRYTSQDKDSQGRPTPRGEICIRGPQVFGGYYKRYDLTREAIGTDGWLRTGDVGEITPELGFKIIDRKKNIFKLQQGQYVAPDRVEACYLRSQLAEQIFLHGASNHNFALAIITPRKDKLIQMAANYGEKGTFAQICKKKIVRAAYLTELNAFGKKNGLLGFQMAKNIFFQTQGFAARKILTDTQKLIRFEAKIYYASQIEEMYREGELKV